MSYKKNVWRGTAAVTVGKMKNIENGIANMDDAMGGSYAEAAEGYALGKANGVDVGSGSPYYHNNAKYFSDQATASAAAAAPFIVTGTESEGTVTLNKTWTEIKTAAATKAVLLITAGTDETTVGVLLSAAKVSSDYNATFLILDEIGDLDTIVYTTDGADKAPAYTAED